jgi:hypothetical protein
MRTPNPRVASSEQIQRMNTVVKTINKRCPKTSADKAFARFNDSNACGRLIASHPLSNAASKSCVSHGGERPRHGLNAYGTSTDQQGRSFSPQGRALRSRGNVHDKKQP